MSKFIGEMSFDEFIDALKIIFTEKEENIPEDTISLKDKFYNSVAETKATIKYMFSFEPFKDIYTSFLELLKTIKYVFSSQFINDVKLKTEKFFIKKTKQQLTKDRFIEEGKKLKSAISEIVETLVFVIVMVIIIRFFIFEIRWIPSGTMHPTLLEGDRIVVEKYSRFNTIPKRGDIMVFYPPSEKLEKTPLKVFARLTGFFCKDKAYIKRVIGLPGEKFEIKADSNGKFAVYINDTPLNEPYIMSEYDYPNCTPDMTCGPAVIPENYYLMLGDNRGNSLDSRFWGLLNKERFIGKATFLFLPINRIKILKYKESNIK